MMVWGAIDANGPLLIVKITRQITDKSYIKMLDELLFGEAKEDLPAVFIFQHNNTTPNAARLTKKYLEEEEIPVLEWLLMHLT